MRRVRYIAWLLAGLMLVAGMLAPANAAVAECDGGDTAATATEKPNPLTCQGTLVRPDQRDYYAFANIAAGAVINASALFATTEPGATTVPPLGLLEVRGPNGSVRACSPADTSAVNCSVTADAAGTWVVGVVSQNTAPVTYGLNVAASGALPTSTPSVPPTPDPTATPTPTIPPTPNPTATPTPPNPSVSACEGAGDAGESPDRAAPLPSALPNDDVILCQGTFGADESDRADWYALRVHSTRGLLQLIVLPPLGGDIDVTLIDPAGAAVPPKLNGGASQPHVFAIDTTTMQGVYRIGVAAGRGIKAATYTVIALIEEA